MTTGNNQFLPFATGSSANVLTAAEYEALTALVANGFQSGIAQSQQVNTPIRQATFVAAAIAQIIANNGVNANDDGNISEFVSNFLAAINSPGTVNFFAMNSAPTGWLKANGAAVSRTSFANLFNNIGTTFGIGDGSTTFNLPDIRGRFLRSFDDGAGADAGRVFGSEQLGTIIGAMDDNSTGQISSLGSPAYCYGDPLTSVQQSEIAGHSYISPESLSTPYNWYAYATTRPRNIALLACIKY